MTICEALALVDEVKPNAVERATKKKWLGDVDGMVVDQLILTHEHESAPAFTPYGAATDEETELLIPAPYDTIYRWYVEAQIHLRNLEMEQFQNMQSFFNQEWAEYKRKYNREHMPLQRAGHMQF